VKTGPPIGEATATMQAPTRRSTRDARRAAVLAVLLLVAAAALWPVTHAGFVFDDRGYILANESLRDGVSPAALRSYLFSTREANWHPLTWLSHAVDFHLFGLSPAPPHAENLLLHLANVALLFLFLERATAALWPSAAAAALFAVHPLRVESVAWVSQRKDLLAGLFLLLALNAYLRWARRPEAGRFLAVAALFALGLMSKQTLVTLPLVLLILDWWPLGRWGAGPAPFSRPRWLPFAEKVPLFVLAMVGGALALWAQSSGGALRSAASYPFSLRAANACVAYAAYLGMTIWPAGLSVFYPFPAAVPLLKAAAAALLLAGITAAAWRWRSRVPAATAGWLWFLITLLPLAGLIQVGDQAMADRYTYLPHIGLFMGAAWLLAAAARRPAAGRVAAAAVVATIVLYAGATHRQARCWRDEFSLFSQALRADPANALADFTLGYLLDTEGRREEAEVHYRAAIRSRPEYKAAHANLAGLLRERGAHDEAETHYREVLRLDPSAAAALYGLGVLRADRGRWAEAIGFYREALRVVPDDPQALNNTGVALTKLGRLAEAEGFYRQALKVQPDHALANYNLGSVLAALGRRDEAKRFLAAALAADPGLLRAREQLNGL